jgi:magnesium transporter
MNFRYFPELNWRFGFTLSVVLMAASAIGPYLYFKRRGWI